MKDWGTREWVCVGMGVVAAGITAMVITTASPLLTFGLTFAVGFGVSFAAMQVTRV